MGGEGVGVEEEDVLEGGEEERPEFEVVAGGLSDVRDSVVDFGEGLRKLRLEREEGSRASSKARARSFQKSFTSWSKVDFAAVTLTELVAVSVWRYVVVLLFTPQRNFVVRRITVIS